MKTKESYLEKMFKGKRIESVIKAFEQANDYCNSEHLELDSTGFEEILIAMNCDKVKLPSGL